MRDHCAKTCGFCENYAARPKHCCDVTICAGVCKLVSCKKGK